MDEEKSRTFSPTAAGRCGLAKNREEPAALPATGLRRLFLCRGFKAHGGCRSGLSVDGNQLVYPASGCYVIGSPSVDKAVIHLDNGNKFTIKVNRKGKKAIYVEKVTLNGTELSDFKLEHQAIINGGTLEFWLNAR
ncbi:MAG TPA: glycoside hydrolase family 92 protein [Candidatus Barnesiella excrementavium]|nr:glycoside hydrolase family 92 protein [Candidatus Barnesiella excrementavium]